MIEKPSTRPAPIADALTKPYWTAAAAHRFELPLCTACERMHFYPRSLCPHCGSDAIVWAAASGRGTIYSYTMVHRAPSAAFAANAPYAVAVVELDEGPHLMSNVIGCATADIDIGLPVVVDFLDFDDYSLPVFRPAEGDPRGEKGDRP